MYYSACVPAVLGKFSAEEAFDAIRDAGIAHYEFWGWSEEQIDSYLAAQKELTPVAMCTTFHDLTEPSGRDAYVEGIKKTIAVCKKLGCKNIISQVGPELSHLSREEQHESIAAGLRAAAPLVEEAGLILLFEPLNTRIDHPGYYLWSMEEAVQIAKEVNSPNVKILCDLYHQYVMDDLDLDYILKNIEKIGHFHMAGYPGRNEPHIDSEVDYKTILSAIRKTGYAGAVGLEYMPVHDAKEGLKALHELLLTY